MRQVRFKFRCNILISGKIIKEMPGSVASGTLCISDQTTNDFVLLTRKKCRRGSEYNILGIILC
jgi:hypothetical protein